jgi:peptidoglycan hydrolase-like protein with peptidoglycan-binding domain
MSTPQSAAVGDPTQAFAAVGAGGQGVPGTPPGPADGNLTWALPPQSDPTRAMPAPSGALEPEVYAGLFRPEGDVRANPNATQVMQPVAAGAAGYDQPAYDQPIDYQSGGGGAYAEPYEGGYADDYHGEPGKPPRSSRSAMIGIGVAAGAVLVIVISLITLGGGSQTPSAGPGSSQGQVVTPSDAPSSTAPSTAEQAPSSSAPSTSASPTQHTPGQLQLGDTGPEVKWLQNRLHQLGVYNGPISGTFDAATQAGVAAFQARTHPADPSGVMGRSTKTALIAAGSKPQLSVQLPGLPGDGGGDKHHKGGGSAGDIKRLQQALATALNTNLKASGQFDMNTFGAVVQYQSAMGMPPDGVVNDKVWAALQQGRITG